MRRNPKTISIAMLQLSVSLIVATSSSVQSPIRAIACVLFLGAILQLVRIVTKGEVNAWHR